MRKRLVIAGLIVAVVLAALGAFHFVLKPAMIQKFIAQNVPPPASVATEVAKAESWVPQKHAIGTLVAIQGVDIAPQVGGVVKAIQFKSGDHVLEGAELVQLDDEVEQADLLSNKATLRDAMLEFQRQLNLQGRGFAAEAKLDEARAARDSAAAAVQRTRAVIAQKMIKAPFSGRLGLKKIEMGQYISPGQAMVTLQALDPIHIDFPVPEQQIGQIQAGQAIELTVDTFPGETFKGVIETLDARVDKETRTLTVRGRVKNPGEKLLPGMFANVRVMAGVPRTVLVIPRTAVTYSLYGDSVYVVKDAQAEPVTGVTKAEKKVYTVERRFIRVGETRDGSVAVSEGIKAGEMVVTTGQLKLKPGAKVVINNEAPLQLSQERPKE